MSLFSRIFSKSPSDLLGKGDRHLEAGCYFDARTCYEDALARCSGDTHGDLSALLKERIDTANRSLAEMNLEEARLAHTRGDSTKAIDHLELVKTLTYDQDIREKAERLLSEYAGDKIIPEVRMPASSCASCTHTHNDADTAGMDESLSLSEYYDLLIRQLPESEYDRYFQLGENFAYAYVAASQDRHQEALKHLEAMVWENDLDIFFCEKGKILHRTGNDSEAESCLRNALEINHENCQAWYNLALLVYDGGRFEETLQILDAMVSGGIMAEQAILMRGELHEASGNLNGAIEQYSLLLTTALARPAAEKLHGVLLMNNRTEDAAAVFKQFLGKCSH